MFFYTLSYIFYLFIFLLGTFADRDADVHYEGEKIAYGLIPPINSFGFFKIQLHSYKKLLKKFFRMTSFGDKFKALWYGPGWSPKINPHLRMGDPSGLPKITKGTEKKFHNPKIGMAMGLYAFVQLSLTVLMLDHFLNVQVELMNKGSLFFVQILILINGIKYSNLRSYFDHY